MQSDYDFYWYRQKGNDLAGSVFAYTRWLENHQSYRADDNERHMRLYGNNEFLGVGAHRALRADPSTATQNRVTLNVVQSMVDTVVSKVTKNKPRPYFLTDAGNFEQQRRAEKLNKFAEGQFYAANFYAIMSQAFRDATVWGTSAVKIFRSGDEIKTERVFIDEILVDDNEAIYGEPRQLHQRKWIHKDVLKAKWPSHKGAIDAATNPADGQYVQSQQHNDMLLVIESWKLPSSKTATDGRHTICVSNHVLLDEKWEKDSFPFVFVRWNTKPLGFFGQGIPEQLTGLQLEINKLLRTIQVSMHLVSVPKVFVEANSKIVTSHLDNKIGGIIKYVGTKPTEGQLGQVPAELFAHVDRLYQRAFEIVGISQLAAQSTKPSGLNSGKALRTFNDLESERFQDVQWRYEQAFLDAAKQMIALAKEIAKDTGNYTVKAPGSGFLSTINWDDVQLEDDQYIMQVFPTNALSNTPSARLQEVQELLQAGFIAKEDAQKLLDFPDLKAATNLANAGVEDINRQIELMIDRGEYQMPEPFQNLQYGLQKMQQAYLLYRSQGAPDERLELFRRWMSDAKALVDKASAEAQTQQAMAQQAAAPIAAPAAPPVSDLMPLPTATAPIM